MNPFWTYLVLHFDFPLRKGNIFIKTVSAIKKYNIIPTEQVFPQIKFSYLIFIKIFAILKKLLFKQTDFSNHPLNLEKRTILRRDSKRL